MKGIFMEMMFNILKTDMNFIMIYHFYLKEKNWKSRKAFNLHEKTEDVIHIGNLKQALNDGLIFKEVHRVIKFSKNAWLKPYIDMNAKESSNKRKKNKNRKCFWKRSFLSWWIMTFLEKL